MNKMKQAAVRVLEQLESAGYEAYLVGGCVRDLFLQIEPKDFDVCTNAHPREILQLFKRTIPTGLQHGTVTVLEQNIPIEVTTFRIESTYRDHRRPTSVTFVSQLEQDLARRDFTMNAMAQDRHGIIYDPFQGRTDIVKKQICCVGNAEQRFAEDALRMIRAARFAAQLQFSLDLQIINAIKKLKSTVQYLSIERIVTEIEKIWTTTTPSIGLTIFWKYELWSYLPVFHLWQWRKVDQKQIQIVDFVDDRIVRWSYILHWGQISSQEVVSTCRNLRLSKADIAKVSDCYELSYKWEEPLSSDQIKIYLLQYGLETTLRASQLIQLIHARKPKKTIQDRIKNCWQQMPVKRIIDLDINGNDLLKSSARKAGPWIQKTLHHLLVQVAIGKIPNHRQTLLKEGCKVGAKNS